MRVKTDENLAPLSADLLREHGHDVATVWDEGLRGHADTDIAETCRAENRALITLDTGFADIRRYPPEHYAGLIVLRVGSHSQRHVAGVLERLSSLLDIEPCAGRPGS